MNTSELSIVGLEIFMSDLEIYLDRVGNKNAKTIRETLLKNMYR